MTAPSAGRTRNGAASPTLSFGKGLWEGGWTQSWSTLQGLASSVLSGDPGDAASEGSTRPLGSVRQRAARSRSASGDKKKIPQAWGPAGDRTGRKDNVGAGSDGAAARARDAAVRARKREGMLESHDGVNGGLDTAGRYKRRTSVDNTNTRQHQQEQDDVGEALVYIHHVQPQDTLAGVVLKYNCQPAIFRKANRLWPNDSIQIRKVVMLPVDACAIKGQPCDPPSTISQSHGMDLLAPTPSAEASSENEFSWGESAARDDTVLPKQTVSANPEGEDAPWTHVRWVVLSPSSNATATEIARLPRATLGFFPPSRRKSLTSSSTVSTPRGSFDTMPPLSSITGSPATTPSRRTSNLGSRPPIPNFNPPPTSNSYFPAQFSGASTMKTPRRGSSASDAARISWMRGPGGVGTMNRNVRRPGPAQDGLNSWATKHLPGLAIDFLPSSSAAGAPVDTGFGFGDNGVPEGGFASSGTSTPFESASGGLGLENAASAIEGWVRRLAAKGPSTPRPGPSGRDEDGDLIELLDGSDDGKGGFEVAQDITSKPAGGVNGSVRADLDGAMRGRAARKGSKSD